MSTSCCGLFQTRFHMETLPPELLLSILSFLNPFDLLSLSEVSHLFYLLARDEILWSHVLARLPTSSSEFELNFSGFIARARSFRYQKYFHSTSIELGSWMPFAFSAQSIVVDIPIPPLVTLRSPESLTSIDQQLHPYVSLVRKYRDSIVHSLPYLVGLRELRNLSFGIPLMAPLPALFSALSQLEFLSLKRTFLSGIPESVFPCLHNLRVLDLSQNWFSKANGLPSSLVALSPSLTSLNLSSNWFTSIPSEIFLLSRLESLNLSNLPLNSPAFPPWSSALMALKFLDMSMCGLNCIPPSISNLASLSSASFSHNPLGELSESITTLHHLSALVISHARLSSLPRSLSRLTSLEKLDLSINFFTRVPSEVFTIPSLKSLHLELNSIVFVPDSFGRSLSQLKELVLDSNPLQGLPASMSLMQQLTLLSLLDVNLSENHLPPWIHTLHSLIHCGGLRTDQTVARSHSSSSTASNFFLLDFANHVPQTISPPDWKRFRVS